MLFCLLYLILARTRMEVNLSKTDYAFPFVFLDHVEKHGQRSLCLLGSVLVIGQTVPKKMNKVFGSSGVSTRA